MDSTPPGWLPNDKATVDPQVQTDLSDVKEHYKYCKICDGITNGNSH